MRQRRTSPTVHRSPFTAHCSRAVRHTQVTPGDYVLLAGRGCAILAGMKQTVFCLLLALGLAITVQAQEVEFPVTALPTEWVSGQAPKAWKQGELTVIECWATWCGPCRAAMPYMEELHKALKDKQVRIIGVNVGDKKSAEEIKTFLAAQPVPPTYDVVIDREGKVHQRVPFKGIPFAFAVREGKVVWKGHPAGLTQEALLALRDGKPLPEQGSTPPAQPPNKKRWFR